MRIFTSVLTGSLDVSGGITGSLLGTASLASTASYVADSQYTTTGFPGNYLLPVNFFTNTFTGNVSEPSLVVRYYPFVPSRNTVISRAGAQLRTVSTGQTGSYRLGIYNSQTIANVNSNGSGSVPGTLLADFGYITTITTASAFTEISITPANQPTLQKGVLYWAAIANSGSLSSPGPANNVTWNPHMGFSAFGAGSATPAIGISVTTSSVAVNNAFPTQAPITSFVFVNSTNVLCFPVFKISSSFS
jgi:hypothetical protein